MNSDKPIVLDCEASGLVSDSYPIEIGYILPNGEVTSYYITPLDEWTHWDAKAEDIHHIPREFLFTNGLAAYDVANRLNSQLAGETVYSDAATYETMWLNRLFDSVGIDMKFNVCGIQSLFIERNGVFQHGFFYQERKKLFMGDRVTQHSAGDDALVIQKAYIQSRKRALALLNKV